MKTEKMTYTKGDWQLWSIESDSNTTRFFLSNEGQLSVMSGGKDDENAKRVCQVDAQREGVKKKDLWKEPDPERLANAKIIAAAPDLLEACMYAVTCLAKLNIEMGQIGDNGDQALQALEQAIKKATE